MREYEAANRHGSKAIYIIAYFLILAVFMAPARAMHMGEAPIFYAMVLAGIILGGVILTVKMIKRKAARAQLSNRGLVQIMFGVVPDVVDADPGYFVAPAPIGRELAVLEGAYDDLLPDRIIEGNPLHLSERFQPNIHSVLGAMMTIVGIRRSGKSNLIATLAEELGRFGIPMAIFDTEDEYGTLVDKRLLPRSVQVGSEDGKAESVSPMQYRVLTTDSAYDFGKSVLEGRLQVVVNLQSWQDEDAAIIMTEIIDGMNDWEQSKRNEERLPVMVFLDEAQKWLPQNAGDSYVSSETQKSLYHGFNDTIVARGGKRGFGVAFGFQRYSQINKNALQSQWKFLFRQSETIDVKKYEALGIEQEDTNSLTQGECFIFGPTVMGFRALIRKRMSKHNSDTPGLANLMRNKSAQPVDPFIDKKYTEYAPPEEERMEDLVLRGVPSERKRKQDLVTLGMNAYLEGATTIDKLAVALKISPWEARPLMIKVKEAVRIQQQEEAEESV